MTSRPTPVNWSTGRKAGSASPSPRGLALSSGRSFLSAYKRSWLVSVPFSKAPLCIIPLINRAYGKLALVTSASWIRPDQPGRTHFNPQFAAAIDDTRQRPLCPLNWAISARNPLQMGLFGLTRPGTCAKIFASLGDVFYWSSSRTGLFALFVVPPRASVRLGKQLVSGLN